MSRTVKGYPRSEMVSQNQVGKYKKDDSFSLGLEKKGREFPIGTVISALAPAALGATFG